MTNKTLWKVILRHAGGGVPHYAGEQRHDRAPRLGDVIDILDSDGARVRATVRKIHHIPGDGHAADAVYSVNAEEN
jgi:hypothetical protein